MKNKTILLIMSIFSALLILTGCAAQEEAAAADPEILPPVEAESFNVMAEAVVVPVKEALLSFPTPGVIAEILVEEGQPVSEGEIIARLEGVEKFKAAVTAAELELLSSQQALDQLYETADIARAQAELNVAQAQIAYNDAVEDREKKDYERVNQNTLDGIYADYVLAEDALGDAEEYFSAFEDRAEDDVERAAALSALANARKARDRARYNLDYALGRPDPEDVAEADALVSVAKARLEDAQRTLEELQDGPDPDDVALAQARVENARAQLASAQSALDDLELKSPFGGVLVASNMQVGEYISPGITAAQVGDTSEWKIETTDLTELNILDVQVGDPVTVNFDAIPDLALNGVVERIKPLGENRQGDITYTILIQLDQQDERLLWNMTAFVVFE